MIVTLAARVLQIIFAAIVLGLSVSMITGWGPTEIKGLTDKQKMPESALFTYGAFCGALGFLVGAVGIVACFIESLQVLITLALDGVAALLFAAGGIAFAVKTGVGSCSDDRRRADTYLNKHGNLFDVSGFKYNGDSSVTVYNNDIMSRCRATQADTAFLWFMFGMVAVTLALGIFGKSGKRGGAMV